LRLQTPTAVPSNETELRLSFSPSFSPTLSPSAFPTLSPTRTPTVVPSPAIVMVPQPSLLPTQARHPHLHTKDWPTSAPGLAHICTRTAQRSCRTSIGMSFRLALEVRKQETEIRPAQT
jgi:hypothetical protein